MPSYRDITVTIHTPFIIEGLPEIAPSPPVPGTANSSACRQLLEKEKRRVSVFIPVVPQSLFWLSYSVDAPPQYGTFFVFKLFVNRQEIVTWCCDEEGDWKGKVMFGLFDTGKDGLVIGGAGMEKRVFKFGEPGEEDWRVVGDLNKDGDEDRHIEVRVCGANMKMRVPREMQTFSGVPGSELEMVPAGLTRRYCPRTFYKFGLVDPHDEPYLSFRFYYRTWEEIDALKLQMGPVDNGEDSLTVDATPTKPTSLGDDTSASKSTASNPAVDSTPASERDSISAQYFGSYPSISANEKDAPSSPSTRSRDEVQLKQYTRMDPSPERGRSRRITHIPIAAQAEMYRQMAIPTTYGGSHNPWMPPISSSAPSPAPLRSPTPPPHGDEIYPFLGTPLSPRPNEPEFLSAERLKRLSIPPSQILRPVIERGPLPPSPSKDAENRSPYRSGPPEQTKARKRAETGGILMTVMANALKRRMTDDGATKK